MATTTLDLSGLKCPLPVLRTRKALARLPMGNDLEVICTDPLAAIDIPALVQTLGFHSRLTRRGSAELVFRIERSHGPAKDIAAQQ